MRIIIKESGYLVVHPYSLSNASIRCAPRCPKWLSTDVRPHPFRVGHIEELKTRPGSIHLHHDAYDG